MKRYWQLVISLSLTAVIGYIIYRGVPDWGEATRVMLRGNLLWLLGGFGFVLLHMLLRATRWGVLLSPAKKGISRKNLLTLTLVKYVINVIPPRVGEVAASILLARKESIPAASVIAASLFERVLDTLTVVMLFGAYILLFSHRHLPSTQRGQEILIAIQSHSLLVFLLLLVGIGVLLLLLRSSRWHSWVPGFLRRWVLAFADGFRALHSGAKVLQVAFLSLAIWLVITAQLWSMVQAYITEFPFSGALLIMALTVVGVAIPTPGGVGGFQFFMNMALVHFFAAYLSAADPESQAAGISNGCYVASMVPVMLIGLWLLNREGLSFSRLSELKE
jgi:glycosyltransferase 2 family protein